MTSIHLCVLTSFFHFILSSLWRCPRLCEASSTGDRFFNVSLIFSFSLVSLFIYFIFANCMNFFQNWDFFQSWWFFSKFDEIFKKWWTHLKFEDCSSKLVIFFTNLIIYFQKWWSFFKLNVHFLKSMRNLFF